MLTEKQKLGLDRLIKRDEQTDDVFQLMNELKCGLPGLFDDFGLEYLTFGLVDYPIDNSTDLKYTISVEYKKGEHNFKDTVELGNFSYVPSAVRYTRKLEEMLSEKGFEKIEPVLNKLFKELNIKKFEFIYINLKTGQEYGSGAPGFFNEDKNTYCQGSGYGAVFYNIDSMVKHFARFGEGRSDPGFGFIEDMETNKYPVCELNKVIYEIHRVRFTQNEFHIEFKLDKPDAEIQKMSVTEFRKHIGLDK